MMLFLMIMMVVGLTLLSRRDRIIRDRLEHAVSFLQRLMPQRRPRNLGERQLRIGNAVEKISKESESPKWLVVEIDEGPRREICMRGRQHQLPRLGVIVVMLARLDVDR